MRAKSYLLLSLIGGLSLGLGATDARAWVRHNLITRYALEGVDWLDKYDGITVTPYTYRDESLNPDFKLLYTNPDPTQVQPPPDKFTYYTLESGEKPGFKGARIGQKISARRILTDYSDEPDWRMDKQLELSPAQALMAGSQGYRHMYYPALGWHLPYLFFPQGAAPERAEHFYGLARQALGRGDLYWVFRFLARAIHYIEDMGQPYHTSQTSLRFITISSPISGTTQTTKNYHFAYESYVNYRLQQEAEGLMPPDYIPALQQAPAIEVDDTARLLKDMARENNRRVGKTFRTSIELFGRRLRSTQRISLTQTEADSLMNPQSGNHPRRDQFDRAVRQALGLTGSGVRGFLEYVKQELLTQ
jgi:hypothetical protein